MIGGFRTPEGVVRIKDGDRKPVDRTVLTAVTDRQILFTTPDADESGVVTLGYEELASLSVGDPALSLMTLEGIGLEWRGGSTVPPGVTRHLQWVGEIRGRVKSCENDVELAAGTIRSHAEALEWDEALAVYRETRADLDELFNRVFCTEPVPETVLAPELTAIERTLEKAHTRVFIERAQSQLELGRQLVENGDFVQGRKVLKRAQEYHERARQQRAAVERGDAFQFGTQRSLKEDIESLGWKIETVAAEPIRQAHEAKIKARSAEDDERALECWERAFERYGHVLTLEWGSDERNFAGDPETVRPELENAASQLIDLHSDLADSCWDSGAAHQDAGEPKAALQCCLDAQKHLERAHELAAEFAPDRVDSIATRLETMADAVMRMRHTETDGETSDTRPADGETPTPASGEVDGPAESGTDRQLPSASELAAIDTHHEITLESEDLQVKPNESEPLEGDRQEDSEPTSNESQSAESDHPGSETRRH